MDGTHPNHPHLFHATNYIEKGPPLHHFEIASGSSNYDIAQVQIAWTASTAV